MNVFEISQKYIRNINFSLINNFQFLQTRHYAARKGTREKMRKKKVKVEVKKVGFIPHNLREKPSSKLGSNVSKRLRDDLKPLPCDDVWIGKYYKWKIYDFDEAVTCHRETHHSEQYDLVDSPVHVFVELDMHGLKKNRYVDPFTRIAKIPNKFPLGEDRSILVFCKTHELRGDAEAAGATMVGDVDLVRKIERGETVLPDIDYIIAHPNILPELICIRGILKRKFPSPKLGTLGYNIGELVDNFKNGIRYSACRDETELDYGWIDAPIGTLDMETKHLEENMKSFLSDVLTVKPKRPGKFVTRVLLKCAPSKERFKINLEPFIQEEEELESDSDEEEVAKAKKL